MVPLDERVSSERALQPQKRTASIVHLYGQDGLQEIYKLWFFNCDHVDVAISANETQVPCAEVTTALPVTPKPGLETGLELQRRNDEENGE